MRAGFSLLEIVVAVLIVGLALGPIITLLGSSNKASNASVYEIMASMYSAELGEQLQRLAPRLKDLRMKTGMDILVLLTDPELERKIGPEGSTAGKPFMMHLPVPDPSVTDVAFFLSPLDPAFTERKFLVTKLDNSDPRLKVFKNGTGDYWDVTISLAWKQPADTIIHRAWYSVILREEL